MKSKILVYALTTMLLLSLAGCSSPGFRALPSPQPTSSNVDNFNPTGYPIVNEKVTLDVMWCIRDVDTINFENLWCLGELEACTNIHVNPEVIKNSDWDTKVNLMFASGHYPDVMFASAATNTPMGVNYEEYGVVQKMLLPLDDLITEYMPIYSGRAAGEEGILSKLVASDGKMYTIGGLTAQNINTSTHYFINKTWLKALNLETPKTVNELTEVLRAFKTGDPNRNGQADEIPYLAMFQHGYSGINAVLPFWGIPSEGTSYFIIDNNCKIQFTPMMKGYREAVEWLHTLYTEELLDIEVISQDAAMVSTKISEGNVGFFTEWRLLEKKFTDWATENATLIDPVFAEGYKVSLPKTMELASKNVFVTASNKNIPATMRWIDAQLETEMMFKMFAGREGTGRIKNDKGLIETLPVPQDQASTEFVGVNGLFFAPGDYYNSVYQAAPHRLEKTEYCKYYTEQGFMQKYSNQYLELAPRTSEEISHCALLLTDIESTVKENLANFITKGVTDQSWDGFIEMFKGLNVDEYMEIYQRALDKLDF